MDKREQVIQGLEHHHNTACDYCPYYKNGCAHKMFDDAIALLKEKELQPRVMTLDEVKTAKCSGTPVYVEDVKEHYSEMAFVTVVDGFDEWVHITFHGEKSIFGKRCREYGTKWRCWTSRPTNKQRKAVAWND